MFTLVKNIGAMATLRAEGLPLLMAFTIAELFYKFHSFALETGAFLTTWYLLSALFARLFMRQQAPKERSNGKV
jgi:hypothetical protein